MNKNRIATGVCCMVLFCGCSITGHLERRQYRADVLHVSREQRERERGDVVGAEGVKLCRVGKDDGQHSDAFQQVEHAKAAYSAGLGAFHEKGPPCAPFIPEAPEGRVLGAI